MHTESMSRKNGKHISNNKIAIQINQQRQWIFITSNIYYKTPCDKIMSMGTILQFQKLEK